MRVLVAGATGVVGRRLVPLLAATGHDVIGGTTSAGKLASIGQLGGTGVVLDVLDRELTRKVVADVGPDAIVHQATALSNMNFNPRRLDAIFEKTNQLRTAGTRNLLAAADETGVPRFVAHSFCGWPFARVGGQVKTESDPLDANPPKSCTKTLAAIKELERLVTEHDGVVLRCGGFYGPGTSLDHNGEQLNTVLKRRLPIVGAGDGVFSFVHVDDVASATLAALTRGHGIYNIVDDEPAAVRDWLPYLASIIGAKPPMKIPAWLARMVAGETAVTMMTQMRGGANDKAKRELSWRPQYSTWRQGFASELGKSAA